MINDPSHLIDELGGNPAVADMLGVGVSAVSNYRKNGFPAWTHVRLLRECGVRAISVSDELFKAAKPAVRKAQTATAE